MAGSLFVIAAVAVLFAWKHIIGPAYYSSKAEEKALKLQQNESHQQMLKDSLYDAYLNRHTDPRSLKRAQKRYRQATR